MIILNWFHLFVCFHVLRMIRFYKDEALCTVEGFLECMFMSHPGYAHKCAWNTVEPRYCNLCSVNVSNRVLHLAITCFNLMQFLLLSLVLFYCFHCRLSWLLGTEHARPLACGLKFGYLLQLMQWVRSISMVPAKMLQP